MRQVIPTHQAWHHTQYATNNARLIITILFIFSFLKIYFWLHWVFVAVRRLSLVAATTSHCSGFSCRGAWALGMRDSVVNGARALDCRLSSCSA